MKSDREVQRMLRERHQGKSIDQAAARAGMSVPTARKYLRAGTLPSPPLRPANATIKHLVQVSGDPYRVR